MTIKLPEPEYLGNDARGDIFGYTHDQLVQTVKDALEEAVQVAAVSYVVQKETEEAHYRLSGMPFQPSNFGFNMAVVKESKQIADAIRAMKEDIK